MYLVNLMLGQPFVVFMMCRVDLLSFNLLDFNFTQSLEKKGMREDMFQLFFDLSDVGC